MTTHWNRPMSCTWTYVYDSDLPAGVSEPIAYLDLEPLPGASTLSCYPDGMFYDGRTGVFSPATCPHGWTTVSLAVNTDQSADEATTTALCCSSEYYYAGGHCRRQVPTVLAVPIIYNHTAATYDVLTNSTTTLYSATIAVNTIRALFREEDKPLLGLTNEDDIDDEPEDDRGLSLGAKIGIGVGVALFGLFALGAGIFLYLWGRERRRKRCTGQTSHELGVVQRTQGQMYGTSPHPRDRARDAEPPPAYDFTPETGSIADGHAGETVSVARDGEIQVLMAQKAAIQRRIEELERASGEESRDEPRER
ncbi:hypothetical protein BBK36DRAFT_1164091 [Trichoderma citrinoviride]|uniref:Uncharacterized protein n=1 Tax=Trichoderma citrinoviride TaxID=58853 RepID=A0A2T4AWD5_9HYPO|nr:hypothetical protein BBK36DRAFT_1164091 [Trichoderma citrinoviride]PTB61384.1 hypothetical protein BBK36DRAFT_1164091 [Trichoderma citrinoviride]